MNFFWQHSLVVQKETSKMKLAIVLLGLFLVADAAIIDDALGKSLRIQNIGLVVLKKVVMNFA